MYDDASYKKTFLKDVIFKLDFPTPIEKIEKGLTGRLNKVILSKFPLSEPQKAQSQEFQFSGSNFQAKTSEIMQWVFHGKDREKTLIINPAALSYTNKKYVSFEELKDDVTSVLDTFFSEYQDVAAGRVGLRYINVIDLKDGDPLAWDEYVNERMLGVFDFYEGREFLTRAFHILEYNFDGLSVKFQFGIANPDFPAPIKKKQFILDIDAFSRGAFELSDVKTFIDSAHDKIQDFFEKSITQKTRGLMEPENAE